MWSIATDVLSLRELHIAKSQSLRRSQRSGTGVEGGAILKITMYGYRRKY